MSTPLTTAQRAHIKHLLNQRLGELRERIASHHEGKTRVEHAHEILTQDYDDAPQRASDREVDLALSDHDAIEVSKHNAALLRIDRPDFGICASCGETIGFERLTIEPTTHRCVACKSSAESRP